MQDDALAIINEDLRFRQLHRRSRRRPAAVVFALDVSGSMDEAQRRLAKQFFFFALQGIRRQYTKVETLFLAHAAQAWEFDESQFFQASSSGGTVSSSVVARLALECCRAATTRAATTPTSSMPRTARTPPRTARRRAPRSASSRAAQLRGIRRDRRRRDLPPRETQLAELFGELKAKGHPVGVSHLGSQDDIWRAIRSSSPSKPRMTELDGYAERIESLARRLGLDYYPVDFELAPQA